MRIAYLTSEYPRYSDIWLQREVTALRRHGAEIETFTVRCTDPADLTTDAQRSEHARTRSLITRDMRVLLSAGIGALVRPRRLLRAAKLALSTRPPGVAALAKQAAYLAEAAIYANIVRRRRIDHLHNHLSQSSCTVTMLTSILSGIPYSFTMHGPNIFYEPRHWRIDEKIRRARFVACISYFCRSQAAHFVESAEWPKLRVVHCGVDITDHAVSDQTRTRPELLFVGRLAAAKGLPILLDAVSLVRETVPDVHLTIVGDGPDRQSLDQLIVRLGLERAVKPYGPATPEDVRRLLAATAVFVLPSFAEGVPVVLMEAMEAGVPVVATRIAGVSELVEDGVSGLLVQPSDPVGLAAALEQLLADTQARSRLGHNGRTKVIAEFDADNEARRLYALFRDATSTEITTHPRAHGLGPSALRQPGCPASRPLASRSTDP